MMLGVLNCDGGRKSIFFETANKVFHNHRKNKTPVLGNAMLVFGVKLKRGWYVIWLFFKIGRCSAISFERSRRELSFDVIERRCILKKFPKYALAPFSFHTRKRYSIPQNECFFFNSYVYIRKQLDQFSKVQLSASNPSVSHGIAWRSSKSQRCTL